MTRLSKAGIWAVLPIVRITRFELIVNICSAISFIDNLTSPSNMWNVFILWIALSTLILTLEMFSNLMSLNLSAVFSLFP